MMKDTTKNQSKPDGVQKALTVIGTILCLILAPVLVINLTLMAKSFLRADEVPSIGGFFPMIVLTDSMYPEICGGDLIICHTIDAAEVEAGDVISFYDPMGDGTSVVTHRVMEITAEGFITQGDNNNAEDQVPVSADKLIGVYRSRIPGMGRVAMFMQTPVGLILCCVCPILLIVGWDMLRRRRYEQAKRQDTDALLAELEALRAMKAQQEQQK